MRFHVLILPALLLAVPGAVQARDKVEVTRFLAPDSAARLDHAAVTVVAAPGIDADSLESRTWLGAVERELAATGFGTATPGASDIIAEVRIERSTFRPERRRNPVSVGVGGSTGGWNSGVGVGIGINLGGPPREVTDYRLSVTLRDRATATGAAGDAGGKPLWEGRAQLAVKAGSKDADPVNISARLARALFTGFPGRSGETIQVK